MNRQRFHSIMRASRRESTATGRTKKHTEHRRKRFLINANSGNQDVLSQIHFCFKSPALRNASRKSFSTAAKVFPAIDWRATRTRSTGRSKSCWCNRKLSRSNRRARARSTAPPIFRLVITPIRVSEPTGSGSQFAIKQPHANRCP